jgi:hypothetical protein
LLRDTRILAILIFVLAFLLFKSSSQHPIGDSKYSMMLSECLIEHHSFQLDHYAVPRLPAVVRHDYVMNGDIYQIEQVGPHLYYFFPPGTSILSVPFVWMFKAAGISAVNRDGSLNLNGETRIQLVIAALLMALLSAIIFCTARLLLPVRYSVLITLGGALGTQIWSNASRGLFTDTWAVLFLTGAIFLLLANKVNGTKLRPVLLATVLAWAYIVYPSYSIHVMAISIYLLTVLAWRQLAIYAMTGAGWAGALIVYSWRNFGTVLPNYFRPGRLLFGKFWTALSGDLISPSRGFLIFVPTSLFVIYLVIRFRKQLQQRALIVLAFSAVIAQLLMISGFDHWWGGHSYGPRLMTAFVPWFVLLSILGVSAMLRAGFSNTLERVVTACIGILLLAASIFIHYRGASEGATSAWNSLPENVDTHPERVWDWRQPQFLAGLIYPAFPPNVPLLTENTVIDFTREDANKYLWYGWSIAEPESRWTDSTHATLIFSLNDIKPLALTIRMAAFIVPSRLEKQQLIIKLNEKTLTTLQLNNRELADFTVTLPQQLLHTRNIVSFITPDAAKPASLNINPDQRDLGIRVATVTVTSSTQ